MNSLRCVLILFAAVAGAVIQEEGLLTNSGLETGEVRGVKLLEVTLNERKSCLDGRPFGDQPANRKDTGLRVSTLIDGMGSRGYTAYVVPTSDDHQSEYVADADRRRQYISGLTGSAGTAVILADGSRALWTDGRYFLQADDQLDCQWLLMKDGMAGVPTISQWLTSQLELGDVVSADPRLIGAQEWLSFKGVLTESGIDLIEDDIVKGNDLLDEQWNQDGRPIYREDPIFHLDVKFAGRAWYDKVKDIEEEMSNDGADVFVITALDEVAWTLNVRGNDIPYNPVFRSYVIIDKSSIGSSQVFLFVPDIETRVPDDVLQVLGVGNCQPSRPCVSLKQYNSIEKELALIAAKETVSKIMIPKAFSTSAGASFYIYNLIPNRKRLEVPSPILLMKATKNEVECAGMRNSHIRDAVALISFMDFMENEIDQGAYWTELSAAEVLADFRFQQKDNMGLSFDTISAFGPNAAIIHYSPTPETDTQITDQNLYLVDSGGQYRDGTTDVTRTVHYGTPNKYQIEAYTRVLIGVIDFATIVFPKGFKKHDNDIEARRNLYSVGLDYRHGTSHGVGMFLNVHEGSDIVFENGFHGSDEPGYYEDGHWGIRIENVIAVTNVTTTYDFVDESYGMDTITMVPMEPKLIDISLLSKAQCEYLNKYNAKIQSTVGPELLKQNKNSAYAYMNRKTEAYDC